MRRAHRQRSFRRSRRFWGVTASLAAVLILALPSRPTAHEIPADVLIRVFVKPGGERLRLLVRVPLEAMRDVDIPILGPDGYLDLARAGPVIRTAAQMWIANNISLYEGNVRLAGRRIVATRVSLPSDPSFSSYADALAHMAAPPLPAATMIPWTQAMLDVLIEYPIASDSATFAIDPVLAGLGLRTTTVLRFLPAGGAERVFQYSGNPGLVRLDPRWYQAALRFIRAGFTHILGGIDHLLFLLCLVVPFRRIRPLVPIVTAFTVAHSITLAASALGLAPDALWFPPLIETLIALSIVYMAFENIAGARLEHRWLVTFGFGLVHGFGFSFFLRETLQFAGSHLFTSLLSFNVGVELGQLFVLLLVIPALNLLFRFGIAVRMGTIILSALVAHTAWHWMLDRAAALRQYQFQWPTVDAALLASALRWLMLLAILGGALWLLSELYNRTAQPRRERRARGAEN